MCVLRRKLRWSCTSLAGFDSAVVGSARRMPLGRGLVCLGLELDAAAGKALSSTLEVAMDTLVMMSQARSLGRVSMFVVVRLMGPYNHASGASRSRGKSVSLRALVSSRVMPPAAKKALLESRDVKVMTRSPFFLQIRESSSILKRGVWNPMALAAASVRAW